MARAVKKVKTQKKHSKKFFVILYSIIGVIVAAGIAIGVWLGCFYDWSNEEETYNYFDKYTEYKINYTALKDEIESESAAEHIFVFMYDGSKFDAKQSEDDTDYSENDEKISVYLDSLFDAIKKVNEEENSTLIQFYIINTALTGNSAALSDTTYLLASASEAPTLSYVYNGAYSSTTVNYDKLDKKDVTISATGANSLANGTYFKEAISYVGLLPQIA